MLISLRAEIGADKNGLSGPTTSAPPRRRAGRLRAGQVAGARARQPGSGGQRRRGGRVGPVECRGCAPSGNCRVFAEVGFLIYEWSMLGPARA